MGYSLCQIVQVFVRPVHAAVQPTVLDVELLHHLPVLSSALSLPYLLKGLGIEVADAEVGI